MLLAWALSLLNPAPLRLRRLGYVRQSGLLHARSRRCRAAWAPHLENARGIVAAAAEATRGRRHAVVLGSGLLDDIPLAILSSCSGGSAWSTRFIPGRRGSPHAAIGTSR